MKIHNEFEYENNDNKRKKTYYFFSIIFVDFSMKLSPFVHKAFEDMFFLVISMSLLNFF